MKKITGEEFLSKSQEDPSWCTSIKTPIEITTYANLVGEEITHLSPLLHFKGKNINGRVASFADCSKLKKACGNFYGFVSFTNSAVENTAQLKVLDKDHLGWSTEFTRCKNLKVLEGEFGGVVFLDGSGLEEIKIKKGNINKKAEEIKFYINNCKNIKPKEIYLSSEFSIDNNLKKKIEEVIKLRKTLTRFK